MCFSRVNEFPCLVTHGCLWAQCRPFWATSHHHRASRSKGPGDWHHCAEMLETRGLWGLTQEQASGRFEGIWRSPFYLVLWDRGNERPLFALPQATPSTSDKWRIWASLLSHVAKVVCEPRAGAQGLERLRENSSGRPTFFAGYVENKGGQIYLLEPLQGPESLSGESLSGPLRGPWDGVSVTRLAETRVWAPRPLMGLKTQKSGPLSRVPPLAFRPWGLNWKMLLNLTAMAATNSFQCLREFLDTAGCIPQTSTPTVNRCYAEPPHPQPCTQPFSRLIDSQARYLDASSPGQGVRPLCLHGVAHMSIKSQKSLYKLLHPIQKRSVTKSPMASPASPSQSIASSPASANHSPASSAPSAIASPASSAMSPPARWSPRTKPPTATAPTPSATAPAFATFAPVLCSCCLFATSSSFSPRTDDLLHSCLHTQSTYFREVEWRNFAILLFCCSRLAADRAPGPLWLSVEINIQKRAHCQQWSRSTQKGDIDVLLYACKIEWQ